MAQQIITKPYQEKAVTRAQSLEYTAFGWIRSKAPVPEELKRPKNADVLMKRKLDFGMNSTINSLEKRYERLSKKKYNKKPLLGIISFLFMLVFLAVAGIELYFGLSTVLAPDNTTNGNEEINNEDTPANEAAGESSTDENADVENTDNADGGIMGTVLTVLEDIKTNYLSKVTSLLEGKTNEATGEYENGIVDTLKELLGEPIGNYINADVLVGIVALLIAIIFIIWFGAVASQPRKRAKNEAKKADIRDKAWEVVMEMRRQDLSLMGRTERKRYLWESIITNAIRNANPEEDDDDDDY